jgi:hypothetical protein
VLAPVLSHHDRASMHSANKLKIGLFGANCSSGRAVTLVPERWSGSWPENLKLARMADAAGIDFLLPIGRWKGYGGTTDYQGATFETITRATGRLASTKHVGGGGEQRIGHGEAYRFRDAEVDHQLVFGRSLHWQVGGLLTLEDATDKMSQLRLNALQERHST